MTCWASTCFLQIHVFRYLNGENLFLRHSKMWSVEHNPKAGSHLTKKDEVWTKLPSALGKVPPKQRITHHFIGISINIDNLTGTMVPVTRRFCFFFIVPACQSNTLHPSVVGYLDWAWSWGGPRGVTSFGPLWKVWLRFDFFWSLSTSFNMIWEKFLIISGMIFWSEFPAPKNQSNQSQEGSRWLATVKPSLPWVLCSSSCFFRKGYPLEPAVYLAWFQKSMNIVQLWPSSC